MYVNYTSVHLIIKKKKTFMYTNLDGILLPELEFIHFSIWLILILRKTHEFIYWREEWQYPCALIWLQRMVKKNYIESLGRRTGTKNGMIQVNSLHFSICLKLSLNRPFWIRNTNFDPIPSRLYLHIFVILQCI